MKFRILLILAAGLLTLSGCKKDKFYSAQSIAGQWELCDIQVKSAQLGDQTIEVYMDLKADGTFELWQVIGENYDRKHFEGTWTIASNVLSGKYSDGASWGADYTVSKQESTLVLTEKAGSEIYVYQPCTIPDFR